MYLDYDEYQSMGGTLDTAAFTPLERKAAYMIREQAAGMTGKRIDKLPELPQAIKDCIFDLISLLHANSLSEKQISSESQSSGGVFESVTYNVLDETRVKAETENIIYSTFYGGGIGDLLYRGLTAYDV